MYDEGRFRNGRECGNQIFILKQLVEKYREKKRKELFVLFMDLIKVYDKICREQLKICLHEYCTDKYLVRGINIL